jgi:hypothetical protein
MKKETDRERFVILIGKDLAIRNSYVIIAMGSTFGSLGRLLFSVAQ